MVENHATIIFRACLCVKLSIMKQFISVIILFFSAMTSFAQQSEVRTPGPFTGVKSAEGIDVYLKKGDKESVRVVTNGSSLSDVITTVSGSYLRIHKAEGSSRRDDVKVYVTYVNIDKISASSASHVYGDGPIKANSMEISVSSAASVELTLNVEDLEASASSAGDIELKGKAESATFEASSAGEVDAYDVESKKVVAQASSAGSIKLSVSNDLVANASSGGNIRYRGNPERSMTNSTSGGSVRKSE